MVWIAIFFLEYVSLTIKLTCSKLDTNNFIFFACSKHSNLESE